MVVVGGCLRKTWFRGRLEGGNGPTSALSDDPVLDSSCDGGMGDGVCDHFQKAERTLALAQEGLERRLDVANCAVVEHTEVQYNNTVERCAAKRVAVGYESSRASRRTTTRHRRTRPISRGR